MKTLTCIACLVFLLSLASYAAAQDKAPGVLTIASIARLPKRIESCEFKYKFHDPRGDRVTTRTLAVEEEKFFIDIGRSQAGFNGKQYWSKDPRRPTPRIENANFLGFKQLDIHPLNAPYSWVWGDPGTACWSDLRDDATWESLAKRMSYQATRNVRGQICDLFVVDYPEQEKKYTVAFSRPLGGFPIQISLKIKGEHFSTGDVLETHQVGGAVIATKGQVNNRIHGKPIAWIDVDVDSIQVNHSPDQSTFEP